MKVRDIIKDNAEYYENESGIIESPEVSIILPTYSRGKSGLLKKALDSVVMQTFTNFEFIIVDDASIDGSFDLCLNYMKEDNRIRIIRHKKNIGLPAISTYEAYKICRGNYIAYMFDDNQWELQALEKTISFMSNNNVKASYGIVRVPDPNTGKWAYLGNQKEPVENILPFNNCVGAGSVVLHREVLEKVGLHDPHLALTRLCDWDLWLRIIEYYRFVQTNFFFSTELGTTQSDSHGNSYEMDCWFFREHQQLRNRDQLLVENYDEIDVNAYSRSNSPYYADNLEKHYAQYKDKFWHNDMEMNKLHAECVGQVLHILIYCSGVTASIMSFTNYKGNKYVFSFAPLNSYFFSLIIKCDIIIFARELRNSKNELRIFEKIKIPCYYYIDDNFVEIAEESDLPYTAEIAKLTTTENLSKFKGIITSCENLKNYFLDEKLHENVLILKPVVYSGKKDEKMEMDKITVGFMGGEFRSGILKKCVIPALKALAHKYKIRFVYPSTKYETHGEYEIDGVEMIEIPRTLNYQLCLNLYNKIGIDILVHCGEELSNNRYKTQNALINASYLDAVLVASNIQPYCADEENAMRFLTAENTEDEWRKVLDKIIGDKSRQEFLKKNAKIFVEETFNENSAWLEVENAFSNIERGTWEKYCSNAEILYGCLCNANRGYNVFNGNRVYVPEKLCFIKAEKEAVKYYFKPNTQRISELGLLFAMEGKCSGKVILDIYKSIGMKITEIIKPIDMISLDGYTDFVLDEPIKVDKGDTFYLTIQVQYDKMDGYLGWFEDLEQRTFVYRLFNRLGYRLPKKDVLFIDCRDNGL